MKKYLVILVVSMLISISVNAQGRGVKIGYIDMEYILQKVPDYTEAKNQLEQKALKWKQEIEIKGLELTKLEESLKTERVLLTKELIEEREEEIAFQKKELLEYQEKRFGPKGDLIVQKTVLVQPVQDQVFTAAQDIAEAKKYDFIFDKSSDLTMLFAAKRFDISDQVIRAITRASKQTQMSKKQLKAEEAKEAKQDLEDELKENPAFAERQKKLDDKKAAREKLLEERKLAADAKKKEIEEARKKLADERAAKKNGTIPANTPKEDLSKETSIDTKDDESAKNEQQKVVADAKQKAADERARVLEERKKNLEEKRAKTLADREAAKKEREEKLKLDKENKNKP
jgi:Skp family chaperone for outer membrane proteins